MDIDTLKKKVLDGDRIEKKEALALAMLPLEELCDAADEIRRHYCGNDFDICGIINGKSGRCSENCTFCAQSAFYPSKTEAYALQSLEEILNSAKYYNAKGILRFSIVTSGKKLEDTEVDLVCKSIRAIKRETDMQVCVSLGLLDEEQFIKLKQAGVTRVHNNLETSESYFPRICTTHTYADKIRTISAAQKAGLMVCSGGILGVGETMEDRIDMLLALRELGIKSVPVNILTPIPGTPLENSTQISEEELYRVVAVSRFLLPDASIRLAGGRTSLQDKGRKCFLSGANAAISGDMLTTDGITIEQDIQMIKELGYIT